MLCKQILKANIVQLRVYNKYNNYYLNHRTVNSRLLRTRKITYIFIMRTIIQFPYFINKFQLQDKTLISIYLKTIALDSVLLNSMCNSHHFGHH